MTVDYKIFEAGPDKKGDDYIDWKMWLGSATQRPYDADRYFRFDIPGTYSAILAVAAVSVMLNWLIGRGEQWIRSR